MHEKVEAVLEKVRPMLQADGGDVELLMLPIKVSFKYDSPELVKDVPCHR